MLPLRVLVVDDEESLRTVLSRWILKWGYDVTAVASADDAIAEMERSAAQIVFTDIIMPVHDGVWLLDRIQERWPETIVIMESGAIDPTTVLKTKKHGAVDFLPKPYGREMVYQALTRAVSRLQSDSQ